MKKILFKLPPKGQEDLFLNILCDKYNINRAAVDILHKVFKDDIFFILNVLAGQDMHLPSIEKLDQIGFMLKIYKFVNSMLSTDQVFNTIILDVSIKFKLTTNQVFSFYNEACQILKD